MTERQRHRIHPTIRQRARELRKSMTPAEARLWYHLRHRQLDGYYFRGQHPIGRFITHFCCTKARLVVEIDGDVHVMQREYDAARTQWLQDRGYRVMRFTNDEVVRQLSAVLESILAACEEQVSESE
jgi:very-short-patch-repair endonuclease